MHVRFSTVIGLPVVDDSTEEIIASISGVLINPDLGKIEGFFTRVQSFFHSEELFLSIVDIVLWGSKIRVRDAGCLSSLEDFVRLQMLLEEGRSVLNQRIITEDSMPLGICRDVQFDTVSFYIEWIFPRRFFRWMTPLPTSSIVIVRTDAIVVRTSATIPDVATGPSVMSTLDPLGTTTVSPRSTD